MNDNKNKKIIQSNIELLRIFSMIIIIAHHSIVHGIFKYINYLEYENNNKNILIIKIFEHNGIMSNAIYFIICGYFHIKKYKINLYSIIWKTCFYGILSGLIGKISIFFGIKDFDNKDEKIFINYLNINPTTSGIYWFVTIYIILIVFSIQLNKFLNKLNKLGYIIFLIFFYIIWYYISYYYDNIYFRIKFALFFYCIGGYLKIYPKENSILNIIFFLILGIIGFIFSMELKYIKKYENYYILNYFIYENKYIYLIGIPISSYGFFNFFNLINIGYWKIINIFGKSCFGVYLIHDSHVLRVIIWNYIINIKEKYSKNNFPLNFIFIVFGIFFVCSFIEIFQQNFIEFYAFKNLNNIFFILKDKFFIKYEQLTTINENFDSEKISINVKV